MFAARSLLRSASAAPLLRRLASRARPAREPYAVLGVARDAPAEAVKLAYYRLAMAHHPDRSDAPDAEEQFADIGAAYAALEKKAPASGPSDPERTWADVDAEAAAAASGAAGAAAPRQAGFASAFPAWVYRAAEYLQRVPQRLDLWLMPSYSSAIYQHVRAGELAEALQALEEMRAAGEQPTHAVYEMLVRGCTLAMRRPAPGAAPDHLTLNLVQKVLDLWGDMQAVGRKPDYLTYIELLRALGKGGAVPQALQLFEKMCGTVTLLPEERAFNSMYEACVMGGYHREALHVFDEHEEMRKSLWKPRFTPVTFSLLLSATAEIGAHTSERLGYLPRVLKQMGSHGVLPRAETCARLVGACVSAGELGTAEQARTPAAPTTPLPLPLPCPYPPTPLVAGRTAPCA